MLSLRSRVTSAIALLLGAGLMVGVLATPAQAAITRSLSISISPTAVNAAGPVSVSGRLTKSPAGSTVKIQRKVGTSWVTATSTRTTSSYGGYRVSVTMPSTPGTYQFRAIAGASSRLSAAVSKTVTATALRKVAVKLASNKSTISVGDTIVLSGKVFPFKAGTIATIQRFNGIRWTTLVTTTISKTGTFKRFLKPAATTTYRVLVPRTGLYATGLSASVKVLIPTGPVDPVITTTTLPDAVTETAYNQTLQVDGEDGTWAVTSGALPPGLALNPNTGAITGTATAGGDYPFTVTFSEDETLLSDTQSLSIKVLVKPRITTTALPEATGFVTYGPVTLQKIAQPGAWSITAGSLPTGITFDEETGVLSGKPTIKVAGTYPLTFRYTETAAPQLSVTRQLTLELNAAPDPVITTTSLPAATAFANYAASVARTGNAGVWSLTAGSLPTGISFDTATGALSGKPTVSGSFPLTFRFTETESGTFASKQLTLLVNAAPDPVITTTSLPAATAFANYAASVARTGNAGVWSITAGSLPTGISFDTATGALSGKPTVSGSFPLTFRFTETESGTFASKQLTLLVNPAPNPVISTSALPDGLINAAYTTTLQVSTTPPGTWSIASGALPSGVTLNGATGVVSGTPTVSGTFPVTFRFTETESGTTATKALSLRIFSRPVVTTTGLPDALRGSAYAGPNDSQVFLAATGGSGTRTWSLASGSLPPGFTLSASGKISGTSSTDGDYAFTVRVSDDVTGATATKALTIHVGPLAIVTGSLPDGSVGDPYSAELEGKPNGILPWSIESGSLPPGVSLESDGDIVGTPTQAGTYTFVVRYVVLLKPTRFKQFTITVTP